MRFRVSLIVLICLAAVILVSCSKKEDEPKSASVFAPPSWLQGAWVDNISNSWRGGFKITSSEYYMILFGSVVNAGYVEATLIKGQLTSTESEFSFLMYESENLSKNYVLTKKTDTTLGLVIGDNVTETIYEKDTSL
jgi:hypothetical protein